MRTGAPVRLSAMHHAQQAAGARFTDDGGWRMAEVYSSVDEETAHARTGVAVSDVSACGKLRVRGEALDSLAMKLTGRTPPGAGRAAWERVDGASVLFCRRAADEALLLVARDRAAAVGEVVARTVESVGCVHVTDLTAAFAGIDVMGPALGRLFERLVALELATLPVLGVVHAELARVHAMIVRLDHPTLPTLRVLVPREYGDFVWHTLHDAGRDLGLVAIGTAAHAELMGPAWRSA